MRTTHDRMGRCPVAHPVASSRSARLRWSEAVGAPKRGRTEGGHGVPS